jgi:hypothetical protein
MYVFAECIQGWSETTHPNPDLKIKVSSHQLKVEDIDFFKKYFNNYLQERLLKQGEVAFGKEYFIDNQILNDRFIKNYKIRIES